MLHGTSRYIAYLHQQKRDRVTLIDCDRSELSFATHGRIAQLRPRGAIMFRTSKGGPRSCFKPQSVNIEPNFLWSAVAIINKEILVVAESLWADKVNNLT